MSFEFTIVVKSETQLEGVKAAEQAITQLGQANRQINQSIGVESSRAAGQAGDAQQRLTQRLVGSRAASAAVQQTFLQMAGTLAAANPLLAVTGNLMGEFAVHAARATDEGVSFTDAIGAAFKVVFNWKVIA